MIRPLTLSQVAAYCSASLDAKLVGGDVEFTKVNTDTRSLAAGELFVALRGERFDAHDFLAQAAAKKVCGLVVEKHDQTIAVPQLVVKDTMLALGQIAAINRTAFNKPLLAITGSSGKTTVKTMLADILSECGDVLATKGNLNNHIGVPLTLLQLEAHHQFAVIEMGASAIGEIAYLCSLAKPQVSMINNVMPAHIAGFGSIEGVAQAKGEIYEGLPVNGIAVVNLDDKFAPQCLANIHSKLMTVSLSNTSADCFAKNIQHLADSIEFDVVIKKSEAHIKVNALGEHSVRNALMAAAMAFSVGANIQNIRDGLKKFSPVGGRMSRHVGVNKALIIDDSYNANPGSVRAAIDVLAAQSGQRILVLGDLAELGADEIRLHAELGTYAKEKQLDAFLTLGTLSRHASDAFGKPEQHFENREQLVAYIKTLVTPATTILIKGSRSAKMDLVVSALSDSGETH